MHDHDRPVFPHNADQKPQNDTDDEREDIPWHNVKPGKAVTHELNYGGNPLYNIDAFQRKSPILVFVRFAL